MKRKLIIGIFIVMLFVLFIGIIIFMIQNNWYLRIFKNTCIKEIDGKNYIGIEKYSNRMDKAVRYYEEYNFFAYHKTDEYIEEFFDHTDYNNPEYRCYNKLPKTDTIVYYFDNTGNITNIKKMDETGALVDTNTMNNYDEEIQYDVEYGSVFQIDGNVLKYGYSKYDKSSYKSFEIPTNVKIINYENQLENMLINNIEVGDFIYIYIPRDINKISDTIIFVAKKEYITNIAKEKLIGTNKIDTSIIYENKEENYIIANIEIGEKVIGNFNVNVSYYLRLNLLPYTKIYLDRTANYFEESEILLHELCFITLNVQSIPFLNDNYGVSEIHFFGD